MEKFQLSEYFISKGQKIQKKWQILSLQKMATSGNILTYIKLNL